MYEQFFGLKKKPFDLVPNPDFLYMSRTHNKAEMYLEYAVRENTGFILLTGEVGSGKTTLIRKLLQQLGPDIQVAKVFNTNLTADQLIETVNDDFGLETSGKTKVQLLKDLYDFLIRQYAHDRKSILIIDEAQHLSIGSLEELRMLSNLETNEAKLLQIILVGQPELRKTLALPELRQLRQRISIHCNLQPLTRVEMEEYLLHRLAVAGDRNAVSFSQLALDQIHRRTAGIPRLINILCDFLLLSAFGDDTRTITAELVQEVVNDPQFEGQFVQGISPVDETLEILELETLVEPAAEPDLSTPPATTHPVAPEDAVRPMLDIEQIHRKLNAFEESIDQVCQSLLEQGRPRATGDIFIGATTPVPPIMAGNPRNPPRSTWATVRKLFSRDPY